MGAGPADERMIQQERAAGSLIELITLKFPYVIALHEYPGF